MNSVKHITRKAILNNPNTPSDASGVAEPGRPDDPRIPEATGTGPFARRVWAGGRSRLLFGVAPFDPQQLSFVAGQLVLLAMAVLASAALALRAIRIDPGFNRFG